MTKGETILVLALGALMLAPLAAAQGEEPDVNESDFNTTAPEDANESYLDDAEAEAEGEPTLDESDFDTTAPAADESYLDEAEREIPGADGAGTSGTPGLPLAGVLAALGIAVVAFRWRSG